MSQTVRQFWGPRGPGKVQMNLNWSIINHDSVVLVSVSEYKLQTPPSDSYRIVTNATISVLNIQPHGPPFDENGNHGVHFAVNVDSNAPVNIVTDITVLNDGKPPAIIDYPS